LQQVRELLKSSGAEVLLCWRFDRVARDQVDLMVLNREVRDAGARLVSAMEGPIENTAMDRLKLSLLGGLSELERDAIIARTHGALRTRAESGKLLGSPIPKYGYDWAGERKERYVPNPATAPIVQRMFAMADSGMSLRAIADTLNREGVPPPSHKPAGTRRVATSWSRQMIFHRLKDPSYCGRHVAYKWRVVKSGSKRTAVLRDVTDERRIEQPDVAPALVSVEVWERVQVALSERTLNTGRPDQETMPLLSRGFAYCGHCGARCITTKHHAGFRGYACPNRKSQVDGDRPPCPGGGWFIKAEKVDADIWAKISEMRRDTARFRQMMLAPLHETQAKIEQANQLEASIAAELEQARKDRDTISRRMATEEDDAIAATYRVRLKETLALITKLEDRVGSQDRKVERLRAYLDTLFSAASGWQDSEGNAVDPEVILSAIAPTPQRDQRRNLLRAIGVRVLIYSTKSDYARENGKRWDFQIVPDMYTIDTDSW
jgi:DNA invertase Pin-like site-specific DNA recombinase